jgi:hypothetical protein
VAGFEYGSAGDGLAILKGPRFIGSDGSMVRRVP